MRKIISQELERIKISPGEQKKLEFIANSVIDILNKRIKKLKINANVFIGGSLAKQTLMKKELFDIDLFIRFSKKYSEKEINLLMKKIFRWFKIPGERIKIKRVHGSRDYYQIFFKSLDVYIEVVPSIKISKPEQARNITDLSYFHVNFIKNALKKNKKLAQEILLAKSFCHGQNCYGAESYIRGFSGYSLEILIIYYKSFIKLLKELAKAKPPLILDPSKKYKNIDDILENLNKAKLQSPIILIDPTFKQRNVISSLSKESFEKFQKSAEKFLKKPDEEFFKVKPVDIEQMIKTAKNLEAIFVSFELKTNKQPGDIAGTKLTKFSKYLTREIEKQYDIVDTQFEYRNGQRAHVSYILKQKPEIIIKGPSLEKIKAVEGFKKAHPVWYIEQNIIKAARPTDMLITQFLKNFKKAHKKTIKEMGVKKIKLL